MHTYCMRYVATYRIITIARANLQDVFQVRNGRLCPRNLAVPTSVFPLPEGLLPLFAALYNTFS